MKPIITIISVLLITAILLGANKYLPNMAFTFHGNAFINGLIKYQLLALLMAGIVILITLKVSPESKILLRFGNVQTIAQKEKWLGINGSTTWKSNGIQLLLVISIATGIFMFLALKYTNSLHHFDWTFFPFVLFISFTNSFSEEIIYRFGINGNLLRSTPQLSIFIISAFLFGLPHYWGYPSGFIGVIMAGLLGYILSKATHETQGIGIACTIHFVQDVIIFTALFMMNAK